MGRSVGTRKAANGNGSVYVRTTKRGVREWVAVSARSPGQPAVSGTCAVPDLGPRPTAAQRKAADEACRALAVQRRDARLAALGDGAPIDAGRMTLGAFADRWIKHAGYRDLRPRTLDRYRWQVGVIKDTIGHVRLADLRREHVRLLWDACPGEGGRAAVHVGFKMLIRAAANEDYPLAKSVLNVEAPKYTQVEAPTMSAAQARLFLAAITDDFWRVLWRLAYVASLRESEVCGLICADVDEIGGQLSLTHQLSLGRKGDPPERVELKANRQRRNIALDPETTRLLAEHRKGRKPGDWLFAVDGEPVRPGRLYAHFKRTCTAAGLPDDLRPHSVRSGSAMAALESGADPETVGRRLGHAPGSDVTSRYYLRRSSDLDRAAAEGIAERLGG